MGTGLRSIDCKSMAIGFEGDPDANLIRPSSSAPPLFDLLRALFETALHSIPPERGIGIAIPTGIRQGKELSNEVECKNSSCMPSAYRTPMDHSFSHGLHTEQLMPGDVLFFRAGHGAEGTIASTAAGFRFRKKICRSPSQ